MRTFKGKGSFISTTTEWKREYSPMGLALSFVLAAFGLSLRADNQLLAVYNLAGVAGLFASSFLIGVVLLCMATLVSAHDEERRRRSIGIGLVSGIAGVVCALLAYVVPVAASATGAGMLLGFGLACLLRQWGRYYRQLSHQGALLNTALSLLIASLWWIALEFAGTPFLFCLGLLVLVVCGGIPLLAREIVLDDEVRAGLRVGAAAPSVVFTMYQVVRNGWAAVVGLMINFFTLGLTFWPYIDNPTLLFVLPKLLAYLVVFVVVWWVTVRARRTAGGRLESFYRIALLIAATLMLAGSLAKAAGVMPASLGVSVISYGGVALCNVLGLVVLFWTAKNSDVGFSRVFALFCTSCAASVAAGMVVFQLVGTESRVIVLGVMVLYVAALVLEALRKGGARPPVA